MDEKGIVVHKTGSLAKEELLRNLAQLIGLPDDAEIELLEGKRDSAADTEETDTEIELTDFPTDLAFSDLLFPIEEDDSTSFESYLEKYGLERKEEDKLKVEYVASEDHDSGFYACLAMGAGAFQQNYLTQSRLRQFAAEKGLMCMADEVASGEFHKLLHTSHLRAYHYLEFDPEEIEDALADDQVVICCVSGAALYQPRMQGLQWAECDRFVVVTNIEFDFNGEGETVTLLDPLNEETAGGLTVSYETFDKAWACGERRAIVLEDWTL